MSLTVDSVDWTTINVPYRDMPETYLRPRHSGFNYYDVFEVELSDGTEGVGETRVSFPPDDPEPQVQEALGRRASAAMWDDSLPKGVQRAVFDAVGRSMGAPIHELLGEKHHDRTPMAWWCIDMAKEDWLAECETAIDRGYRAVKLKGRPWRDIRANVEHLSENLPEWFSIGIDFNRSLLDADRAIPILQELDQYPQIHAFEGPIPYDDVEGGKRIRDAVDAHLVLHYGTPEPTEAICEGVPEGFVFYGAPPSESMKQAHVAATADLPGWLQYPGTGLSAAFMLHYGAVFETATWAGVSTYEILEHPLIEERIPVEDGHATVPDDPGLGYELDREALATYEVEKPEEDPNPPVLVEVAWPDGTRAYMATNSHTSSANQSEEFPFYKRGVSARRVPDDGSDAWRELHETALEEEPYITDENPLEG